MTASGAAGRALYRLRQFWLALQGGGSGISIDRIRAVLDPGLVALFLQMQPSEQAHSYAIYCDLAAAGETDRDLLTAALLHDVGKARSPLRLWERAAVVLGRLFLPARVRRWGSAGSQGGKLAIFSHAFQVAEQHPAWGAEMARRAGASARACRLILRHQDKLEPGADQDEDRLLGKLQAVDDRH
jgi:putative nucleotidyltransferase with HDIG domain